VSSRDSDRHAGAPAAATVRFYAELNDYLAPSHRFSSNEMPVTEQLTVADILANAGVPKSEVDLVLIDGRPACFEDQIAGGDRLSAYPVFETFDISSTQRLREHPLRASAFVLDVHLGKLASFLRMLGFDAAYSTTFSDNELIAVSLNEHRTLLSKDRALLRDPQLIRAALVRANDPRDQIVEVVRRFQLERTVRPFSRCMHCNSLLTNVTRDQVLDRIPPRVRESLFEFTSCPECHRIYWKGSHYSKMDAFISDIIARCADQPAQKA
jgi:uncharacterized protein